MRWILLILGVFGFCGGVAVTYWRQTGVDVSTADIFLFLIFLPSVLVGSALGIYHVKKWQKKHREANAAAAMTTPENVVLAEDSAAPWLHVYTAVIQAPQGEHAVKILEHLQQWRVAESDAELLHVDGTQRLSRRMDLDMNPDVDHESHTLTNGQLSARAARIQTISQNIFEQLDPVLAVMVQGMSERQAWHSPSESRQAILHPAWQGKSIADLVSNAHDTEQPLVWPTVLNILFLLPDHLEENEQQYLQQWAYSQLLAYGFQPEQLQWTNHMVGDSDQALQSICDAFKQQMNSAECSMLLMIGVDSGIDQAFIDQIQTDNERLILAEAGFGLLTSNESTPIADLPVLARLTAPILATRQKPINAGGRIAATALQTSLDELRRIYKVSESLWVPESGILISDVHPQRSHTFRELTLALAPFELSSEQVMYSGCVLEDTDTMMPGVALTLAIQHADASKLHVPVLCSSGHTLRGAWLAAPMVSMHPNEEVSGESSAGHVE